MRNYYVDGSCKGIALGLGLWRSMVKSFMQVHSYQCFHLDATPMLAEIFAFECALNLLQEQNPMIDILKSLQKAIKSIDCLQQSL